MKRIYTDLLRVGFLTLIVGLILYWMDESNIVVVQAMLISLFMVGGTHLTRRILFPRLDLQAIATDACVNNKLGAAIVFAAVVLFLVAVMFLSMSVLK